MAVYTNLNNEQLSDFLKLYKIGKLISFTGITEGIENSNFHLKTSCGEFILTIFENRVNKKDLPFFIDVMLHLNNKEFISKLRNVMKNASKISKFHEIK